MKRILYACGMSIFISISLASCNTKETKDANQKPAEEPIQAGEDYTLAWADEFEGTIIDSANWNLQVLEAGQFNEEWQRYTNSSENAYIEDGSLVIKAIHTGDEHGLDQYTSARLNTAKKQSWKYGKIAARIKLPHGQGIWPAFWMLGTNISENGGDTPWPQSGEIDILELYGTKDDGIVEGNIHYANSSDEHEMMGAVSYVLEEGKFADDYHIFELDWDADSIVWQVDGTQYASAAITDAQLDEFHKEFFILFNLAVGGTWAGRPDETTPFPQRMYIDWVRVYKKVDR
jgi:beta-glucanase (GH16 family)